jgi:hypothetical protein
MIPYLKDPKDSTENVLDMISNVAGYKISNFSKYE